MKSKQRKCKNPDCDVEPLFIPQRPLQRVCSFKCALAVETIRNKEKAAKAIHNERKERLKTKPQLEKAAQHEFNKYIRLRDEKLDCIGCNRPANDRSVGRDCGHFRSIGAAPELRFNEDNANGQCSSCNKGSARYSKTESTVTKQYRKNLVKRIGLERVEALETYQGMPNWTHDDLRQIKAKYRKKWQELEKQLSEVSNV